MRVEEKLNRKNNSGKEKGQSYRDKGPQSGKGSFHFRRKKLNHQVSKNNLRKEYEETSEEQDLFKEEKA